jgi:hypothetical protein
MHSKEEIISGFKNTSNALHDYIQMQSPDIFEVSPDNKWSAGQHLDHMIRSVKPLNLAYRLPYFILRIVFGKPNRQTRNYEALVERYKTKLATGAVATGAFVPPPVKLSGKTKLLKEFTRQNNKLCIALHKYNEAKLDKYLLPHPLLGKITLREMMFFTVYHNEHHLQILKDRNNNV